MIVEEGDIHGDGVNVAARLEALAETGGICVSGTVRDHIGERLDLVFDDLGDQNLKNTYCLAAGEAARRPTSSAEPANPTAW